MEKEEKNGKGIEEGKRERERMRERRQRGEDTTGGHGVLSTSTRWGVWMLLDGQRDTR